MRKDCGVEVDLPGIPVKLAAPARRALAREGITQLAQLTKRSELEIANLHGIGPNALKSLKQAMAERGLSFARNS